MIFAFRTNAARLLTLVCAVLSFAATLVGQPPSHGPSKGYLLITGGATESRDYERLVQSDGGSKANIVVIPNASVTRPTTQADL